MNTRAPESWTYYERLGVSERASEEEIREAYRKVLKDLHPDHRSGPYQTYFDDLMKGVNEARDVLLDPGKRAAYDLTLGRSHSHGNHAHQSNHRNHSSNDRRRPREEERARQKEHRKEEHRREESHQKEECQEAERRRDVRYLKTLLFVAAAITVLCAGLIVVFNDTGSVEADSSGSEKGGAASMESGLPPLDRSMRSIGSTGITYRMTAQEGGTMGKGAKARKIYARTHSTTEEDLRAMTADISYEVSSYGSPVDFLWVEFYEDSIEKTTGVVLVLDTDLATQYIDNPQFSSTGGERGDGVYILTGEQLEGYPSGKPGFQAVG